MLIQNQMVQNKHLDRLLKHISLVQEEIMKFVNYCEFPFSYDEEFKVKLVANSLIHDHSKFKGIEWLYLRNDVNPEFKKMAIFQHINNNKHHPEYWGGVDNMPNLYLVEMVADWSAMSREFENNLHTWYGNVAFDKFGMAHKKHTPLILELINFLWNKP